MNERLRAAREASGMTQERVAKEAGVSTRLYQGYEYGSSTPNVRTAIRIARALGTSAEALFGDTKNGSDEL